MGAVKGPWVLGGEGQVGTHGCWGEMETYGC